MYIAAVLHFKTVQLRKEHFIPKWNIASQITGFGISSFITQTANVLVIITMSNVVVKYGALS